MRWAVLTGEYPPPAGGVGDHVVAVARELIALGDEVQIFAPRSPGGRRSLVGETIHELDRGFSATGLAQLGRRLRRLAPGTRVLLEYVPQTFGRLNLPLCSLLALDHSHPLDVMFHEVCVAWPDPVRAKPALLAAGQRLMAALVANRADRLFLSTDAWRPLLEPLLLSPKTPVTLPVPSTLPTEADHERIAAWRRAWTDDRGAFVIGHFGTYGAHITDSLTGLLGRILAEGTQRKVVLLGMGGARYAQHLRRQLAVDAARIEAPDALAPEELVAALCACDLLVQFYPEGITTRRSSVVGPLALGCAVISNRGRATESFWDDCAAVALAPSLDGMLQEVTRLEHDAGARQVLNSQARALYRSRFAAERTAAALRDVGEP